MRRRAIALLGLGSASILAVALTIALVGREDDPKHPETVIVPGSNADDVQVRFDLLRSKGLRVAIPERIRFEAVSSPVIRSQSPRPGSRVKWGSVVTLRLFPGGLATPIGPEGKPPTYRVPDFTRQTLAEAVEWTEGKWVHWAANLPPLPPSSAEHLLDAYVVTSQRPAEGSTVTLWRPVREVAGQPGGARLTPVVLEVALRD